MAQNKARDFTGALVELDDLIERERASAATVIEAAFAHDIQVALIRVGEINKINSARIVAAAQVASTKAATDAEVCSATLASMANAALTRIRRRGSYGLSNADDSNMMIKAASEMAAEEIGTCAADAINAIALEAQYAV